MEGREGEEGRVEKERRGEERRGEGKVREERGGEGGHQPQRGPRLELSSLWFFI